MTSGKPVKFAVSSPALAPKLKDEYPEITNYTRIRPLSELLFKVGEKLFYEGDVVDADSTIFDVFTFNLLHGDPKKALSDPNSLVISSTLAKKLFEGEDPMHQSVILENDQRFIITGVFEDLPSNVHVPISAMLPISRFDKRVKSQTWPMYEISGYTYLLVNEEFDPIVFKEKLGPFYEKYVSEDQPKYNQEFVPVFQKLADVHYGRNDLRGDYPIATPINLKILMLIGLLIILLTCFNYINLTTATIEGRYRSISVKKVVGASNSRIIFEVLSESAILSLLSIILSLVLVTIIITNLSIESLPPLTLNLFEDKTLWVFLLGLFLTTGIVTGLYPSISFSRISFQKNEFMNRSGKKNTVRNILIFTQFLVSIAVINFTFLSYSQISFMKKADMGFDSNQLISIQIRDDAVMEKYEVIRNDFLKHDAIKAVTAGLHRPGSVSGRLYQLEGDDGMEEQNYNNMRIYHDYLPTLGISLVDGRFFNPEIATDPDNSVLVNEALVRTMNWQNPIGKRIVGGNLSGDNSLQVIGVVKDFNVNSLHAEIPPLIIHQLKEPRGRIIVKYEAEDPRQVIAFLESNWRSINPDRPLVYDFLGDEFSSMYKNDDLQSNLVLVFSCICISISLLGLFGLTSFMARSKKKEIGIRKVLGATIYEIILLLSQRLTLLMLTSIIVASILSVVGFEMWLENFAYHIDWSYGVLLATGIAGVSLTWLTSSFHFVSAAHANPADVLQQE